MAVHKINKQLITDRANKAGRVPAGGIVHTFRKHHEVPRLHLTITELTHLEETEKIVANTLSLR